MQNARLFGAVGKSNQKKVAAQVVPDEAIKRKFRSAIRQFDAQGLAALIRQHLEDLPANAPLWSLLAELYGPHVPKDAETGLALCLGAVLDDRDDEALRALVRTAGMQDVTNAEAAAWVALRNALAAEGEVGRIGLRLACQWFMATATAKRWPNLRTRVLEWQANDGPDDPAVQWAMVGDLARKGDAGAVWLHFDRLVKARITPPDDDLRLLTALAKLPSEDILSRLQLLGRRGWPAFRMKLVNAAARHVPLPLDNLRRPLVLRSKDPIVISEDGGAGLTAIVFNGRDRMLGAPFAQVDAVLAERGIRTIHLFDEKGTAYITGAAGQPSVAATFDLLRDIADQTPGNRLITIGHSMSSIAACAYGLNLKVDGVIGLASATTGTASARALIGEKRAGDFASMAEGLAGEETDLRTWFQRISHWPLVHLHYAAGMKVDKAHAERIAEFDGVKLIEVAGHYVHSLPAEMLLRGTLGSAIDQMITALGD